MVNKAIYSIPIFSPQAAPPAGPLIIREGAFGTRTASVLAALAAVWLVGGRASEARAAIGLAALAVVWLRRILIENFR